MIHGKTKIELYDVNKKIKHIVKSENTFQNTVLADYFRHYGEEGCDPFRSGSYDGTDLWKNALGGIFQLKNPETVGNKFMVTHPMVYRTAVIQTSWEVITRRNHPKVEVKLYKSMILQRIKPMDKSVVYALHPEWADISDMETKAVNITHQEVIISNPCKVQGE